jgi:repressor LexA
MIRLSPKKRRVFEFIERYMASNREAPTIAEISRHFDMRSPASVHGILVHLEANGLIRRTPNISRGIEIVRQPTPMVGWLDR